jgi:uncharacterized protein
MSQQTEVTPAPEVVRRDLRFDLEERNLRTWHPQGLHVSHFFNALSIFFPEGESLFIDAVRHYSDRIHSPKLEREVKGFLGQEAMHSREHRRYNRALAKAGLPAEELEQALIKRLDLVRKLASPEEQLAVTIALEHFTAIMANTLLSDDRILAGADPCLSAVWRWHAIEETEHKAVAYDVYQEVMGGKGYWRRARVMLLTTVTFWLQVFLYHFRLVRADGAAGDLGGWWRLFRFLWVSPGGMRKLIGPWLAYFRPSFHPWQDDNLHLVESWKAAYETTGHAPA